MSFTWVSVTSASFIGMFPTGEAKVGVAGSEPSVPIVRKPWNISETIADVSSSLHQDVRLSCLKKLDSLIELKLGFVWEYWLSSVTCTVRQAQGFPEIGVSNEINKFVKLTIKDKSKIYMTRWNMFISCFWKRNIEQ